MGASVVSVTPPHMLVQSPGDDVPSKFVAALRYVRVALQYVDCAIYN
jgi:hypothetical protein